MSNGASSLRTDWKAAAGLHVLRAKDVRSAAMSRRTDPLDAARWRALQVAGMSPKNRPNVFGPGLPSSRVHSALAKKPQPTLELESLGKCKIGRSTSCSPKSGCKTRHKCVLSPLNLSATCAKRQRKGAHGKSPADV